jgi:hypothetical protein
VLNWEERGTTIIVWCPGRVTIIVWCPGRVTIIPAHKINCKLKKKLAIIYKISFYFAE